MSEENAYRLGKLVVLGMIIQLLVISYVFYVDYRGRSKTVNNQRAACERGKLDRASNAEGWRIAEAARRESGDLVVAVRYSQLARDLEERAQINCEEAFPRASLIP